MITVTLYENQIRALLDLIEQDENEDHPEFLALRGAYRRLTAARDSMPGQPLDEDLDCLNVALMSLRAGAVRDLLLARLHHVHRVAAVWRGAEELPVDLQRRFLRLDLIDSEEWAKEAAESVLDHGLGLRLPMPLVAEQGGNHE